MKKILLLTTGGTIASVESDRGLKPQLTGEELIERIPELSEICKLSCKPVILNGSSNGVDSTNMQPENWVEIAKAVYTELVFSGTENYDGIVITHGTDTMAYTSSMLSFMITNLDKPVILTGSQRPISDPSTDAKKNLLDAVRTAVEGHPGVYIVFGGLIIRGIKASKVDTKDDKAFASVNAPLSGRIEGKAVIMDYPLPHGTGGVKLDINIVKEVFPLILTPGINPDIIEKIVSMGYRGIVIEVFGLGGLPDKFCGPIRSATEKGVSVVGMTQCRDGKTDFSDYEVGREALKAGIIPVSKMTFEAAVTKLMWVLGHTSKPEEVEKMMQKNLCGELSP